jgi:hypothetical protein
VARDGCKHELATLHVLRHLAQDDPVALRVAVFMPADDDL